jgi:hypothetical protein
MVENKADFGHEHIVSAGSHEDAVDPPLVHVTIAHPEPSAPVEQAAPFHVEATTGSDEGRGENMHQSTVSPPYTNESSDAARHMVASGITAAVFGFLFLGGPIGAVILGFSTAYASQKDGTAGYLARSVGIIGVAIKEKAKHINDKHHIIDQSSQLATKAWEHAKVYDRKHHIIDKFLQVLQRGWQYFTHFVQEHRIFERGVESAGRAYEFIAERVGGSKSIPTNIQPAEGTTTRSKTNQNHNVHETVSASTY